MAEKSTGYNAPILYKAFSILAEIARVRSGLGVSDLAHRLSISKSTVYGITQALTAIGALSHNAQTRKFFLGPTLVKLGHQAGMDIRSLVRPHMDDLRQEFNATVFMGTYDKAWITIIAKAGGSQELRIDAPVGTRIPPFAGAAAKVFLAGQEEDFLDGILREHPLPKYTANTISDPRAYRRELEKVRQNGYATDFEEYIQGVNAISVPLPDSAGRPVAALWMVGFSHAFAGEKIQQAVAAAVKAAAGIGPLPPPILEPQDPE